ncbi:MAG: sensor histidine kinase [Chitinophagaceae bacterium]
MKWNLPRYSAKDHLILSFFVGPFTISINSLLLGSRYFSDWSVFFLATVVAAADFSIGFIICLMIGVWLRRLFEGEEGIGVRLLLMIFVFLIMTIVFLLILFYGYEWIPFFHYQFDELSFAWACIGTGIYVVFITFLIEGLARYEIWKNKMKENEQLSRMNRQSRLQGLKSQVNPHFLFNSLNSLSSLIDTDEDSAEKFLDEMSKVYRYMLRTEEESLVSLAAELNFIGSYYYLLKERYGDGLLVEIDVLPADLDKCIPPLTLQTIVENAFTQNVMMKDQPLMIRIGRDQEGLVIRNNIQPKTITEDQDVESGIDNLVTRYSLLHQAQIRILDSRNEREVKVPLFKPQKSAAL